TNRPSPNGTLIDTLDKSVVADKSTPTYASNPVIAGNSFVPHAAHRSVGMNACSRLLIQTYMFLVRKSSILSGFSNASRNFARRFSKPSGYDAAIGFGLSHTRSS